MMNSNRRTIAVITSEVSELYQAAIIGGMTQKAAELNYNVAVIGSFLKSMLASPNNEIGENSVFDLINYDKMDGFVIIPNSIEDPVRLDNISKKMKATGKPVVSIDASLDEFYGIFCDDYTSIKNITNHLIKDHGYRKINCLTGYQGMNLSQRRLEGYFDALTENGILIEKDRYAYGDFWTAAANAFVEHIFSCGLELPEAIVCANDIMAITVCKAIEKHGLRVPDDIAVTGFDHIDDGKVNNPQISSIEPPMWEIGLKAVEVIDMALSGKKPENSYYLPGKFIPSQSCGCPARINEILDVQSSAHQKMSDMNGYLQNANIMWEDLLLSADQEEMFKKVYRYLYLINGIETLYVFMNSDWDVLDDEREGEGRVQLPSDTVECRIAYNEKGDLGVKGSINRSEMFPPMWRDDLPASTYFFSPICFKDKNFGYTVSAFKNKSQVVTYDYRQWIRFLSTALEHLRSQQHLQWALARLKHISEIDTLTGAYNRLGYQNRIHSMLQQAKDQKKDFLIIYGDLDCLKTINDRFGHVEGDNAIRIIAKAFQNSFIGDEICARLGGDEFLLAGVGCYDQEKIDNYNRRINEYLEHYNENSSKPYLIGVSLGCFYIRPDNETTLDYCIDQADAVMYSNKNKKEKKVLKQ